MPSTRTWQWVMLGVAILVISIASFSACGSRSARSRPPSATITAPGQSLFVQPVSYCWDGLCVDGVLAGTLSASIRLARGEAMTLRTSALSNARAVAASWSSVEHTGVRGEVGVQRAGEHATLTTDFTTGRWEVDVLVTVDGGDVGYSFVVDVI